MNFAFNKRKEEKSINKPLRILHFVSSLDKGSGVMGVIMNYYRNIDREKIQFDFIYFIDKDVTYHEEISKLGGFIYRLSTPKNTLKFVKDFKNSFFNSQYSILHLHEVYLNSLVNPIARYCGISKIISHSHATRYSDKKLNAIRNRILCIPINKNTTYRMACSKAAGAFLYGRKVINENNIYILNNAIDCDKFRYSLSVRMEKRNELKLDHKLVIGHVGRFNEQKNHIFLINVFAEIYKKQKNAILILVGDGPLKEKVQDLVKKFGLEENVLFLGLRNDVNQIIQAMDVFVLPSVYEGLPVIGVEAQAAGLPCIMSDAITKEIDFTNVTFVSLKKKPEYWAEKIISAFKEERKNTIDVLTEVGFNIKVEVRKLEEFYLNI